MSLRPATLGVLPEGARLERIRSSSHYVNGRFENTVPVASPLNRGEQLSTMAKFMFGGERRVPDVQLPVESPLQTWAKPSSSGLRVTWLGHSTCLLEIDGLRVLTDPVWGPRASPLSWAGPARFHPVPVGIDALPPLDAVLVSHDHYDHLDFPTITALAKLRVPFFTSLGVGAHLEAWGVAPELITELDWWDTAVTRDGRLSFTAAPARHFSGRGMGGANQSFWSSWVMSSGKHKVFFSGDTGITPEFEDIGAKLGPFDLVMLEVGAFDPSWSSIHLGPDNALVAHQMLKGKLLMPVHWGTFNLGLHAWDAPAETLVQRAPELGVQLMMPRLGQPVEPSHTEGPDLWWRGLR